MFETLGVSCEPGSKASGRPVIGETRDGSPISLPVRIVSGASDGPVLCLTGVIHGDELNGWAAINRICDEVDPKKLSGTIVAFPLSNPFAFMTKSRISALDYERLNLNRVFPGNPNGLITERLAAAIYQGGIEKADYHIDFHEGGYDFIARYLWVQRVDNPEIDEKNVDLARAFGMGVPINLVTLAPDARRLGYGGSSGVSANMRGIPSICNELGGAGRLWPEHVETSVNGVRNVMKHIGMLSGDPVTVEGPQHLALENSWPRPKHGGFWEQVIGLGDIVEEGQLVGRVRNAFGEVVEEMHAPYRSIILDIRNSAAIMTGEWTVNCARIPEDA